MRGYLLPAAILLCVSCTTTNEIIIDEKGVNMSRYSEDLSQCQEYSQQVAVGQKAAKGAASGAVLGGLIGAVGGGRRNAEQTAGVGAITGGAKGVNEGERQSVQVVKNCLRGRGYKVLN